MIDLHNTAFDFWAWSVEVAKKCVAKMKTDDKAILLKEVQHRVANSLQIIASILMQSARRLQSDETRGHLKDAHGLLMSVVVVQKQFAASTQGEVALRTYFTQVQSSGGRAVT